MKLEFKKIKDSASPSDEFRKRLWQRIDAEVQEPARKSYIRRYVYVFGVITIVVTTMSTGTYAYASSSVTPDSSLYGVKTSIESVESIFYRSPESMSAFYMRMAHRRNRELDHARTIRAQEKLEARLSSLLGEVETELDRSNYKQEVREAFYLDLRQIHDQRFREQADAQYDELLRRLNEFEQRGEIDHDRAERFREDMHGMGARKIYRLQEHAHELEMMRDAVAY